ncbi:PfkB family carbohydrate kinase, partial [Halorubrum ezzemoulense]|uniref:carbohydrate kinase family protein n=1 Tax=Halorubrum ezzemoulense TaxID=337243 RepID=UPI00232EEBD5
PDARTALAFVSPSADAAREFTFYRQGTADRLFDASGVPDDVLDSVAVVVVGGVTLTVEPARSATFDLVERARETGCRVCFDPNVRPELWEVDPEPTLRRMLSATDVLKASGEDLGVDALPADPDELLDAGPDAVFLTEGDAGARLIAGEDSPWGRGEWRHGGYRVDGVTDTTGAGDAFTAGVVAGLVDGTTPEELLGFANAVSAASTRSEGAMTALPNREAVRRVREDA